METDPVRRRLDALKEQPAELSLADVRERQLRHSIEIMNHLLASPHRPQTVQLLRGILQARAAAHVKKNSLPGLF